jgi:hypothetical protein
MAPKFRKKNKKDRRINMKSAKIVRQGNRTTVSPLYSKLPTEAIVYTVPVLITHTSNSLPVYKEVKLELMLRQHVQFVTKAASYSMFKVESCTARVYTPVINRSYQVTTAGNSNAHTSFIQWAIGYDPGKNSPDPWTSIADSDGLANVKQMLLGGNQPVSTTLTCKPNQIYPITTDPATIDEDRHGVIKIYISPATGIQYNFAQQSTIIYINLKFKVLFSQRR